MARQVNEDPRLISLAREARAGDTHAAVELERKLKDLLENAEELVHQTVVNRPLACEEIGDEIVHTLID